MQPLTLDQRMKLIQEIRAERCFEMLEEADRRMTGEIDAVIFSNPEKASFLREIQQKLIERQEREDRQRLWKGVFWGLTLSAVMLLSIAAILRWS